MPRHGSTDKFLNLYSAVQREPSHFSATGREHLLSNRHSSLPLLTQPSNYYLNGQFESMSPYHYARQPNGIQQNGSPITSSGSFLPYSAALQTRTGDDGAPIAAAGHHLDVPLQRNSRHIAEQNDLSHPYPAQNLSHSIDTITDPNYLHPSALSSSNLLNVNNLQSNCVDYTNELSPEFRAPLGYPHQRLISNHHNMVRRHRSLPPGSFQREYNLYPSGKHPLSDQVHQRSSSFKFPVSFYRVCIEHKANDFKRDLSNNLKSDLKASSI